jgi:hypothetical protein
LHFEVGVIFVRSSVRLSAYIGPLAMNNDETKFTFGGRSSRSRRTRSLHTCLYVSSTAISKTQPQRHNGSSWRGKFNQQTLHSCSEFSNEVNRNLFVRLKIPKVDRM